MQTGMKQEFAETLRQQQQEMELEHANALADIKRDMTADITKLTQAVMTMANTMNAKPRAAPAATTPPRRHPRAPEPLEDESNEEDITPPCPRRRPSKRAKITNGEPPEYVEGKKFKPDMKWRYNWSSEKKTRYNEARKKFCATGTPEALGEKIGGLDAMINKGKDKYTADKLKLLKAERAKWKAELDKVE